MTGMKDLIRASPCDGIQMPSEWAGSSFLEHFPHPRISGQPEPSYRSLSSRTDKAASGACPGGATLNTGGSGFLHQEMDQTFSPGHRPSSPRGDADPIEEMVERGFIARHDG